MAALVCEDPDTGEYEALHGGVCNPCCESEVDAGEERDVGDCEVDQDGEIEVIADNICHGAQNGRLEAVRRDCIVDLLHGEGGELELIPMQIEMFGSGHLGIGD